jgi:hypothetical protein
VVNNQAAKRQSGKVTGWRITLPLRHLAALPLCLFLLVACRGEVAPPPAITPAPDGVVVRLGVVSSATTLVTLVEAVYEADGVFVDFVVGNQSALLADLAAGRLDGLLLHHIPAGNENWFNPVAVDGLVIVVHPDNPVSSLTLGEVQAVFNGRIVNWSSLGGSDRPIHLVSRETGAGARTLLNRQVLAEQRLDINAAVVSSDEGVLTAVAADPQAIGYSLMGNSSTTRVKLLAIDDIPPTRNEVGSQRYPLTVPLYYLHGSPDEPEGHLRHFLAWLQSPAGQQVVGHVYGRVR